jgi:ATP-dependent DNA helicase RecG
MLAAELAEIVRALRDSRTDLARVEAKRATRELPKSTRETLSAFANSPGGGVILLGLDETHRFAATGVADPKKVRDSLADLSRDQMAPPLAPLIEIMEFEGVQLVVAEVAELDRGSKPCYYRGAGMANGSYVRVGDGDYRLGPAEVHALVAARGQPVDDTVPVQNATPGDLMPEIVGPYLQRLRLQRPFAFRDLDDRELLLATRVLVPGDTGPVPSSRSSRSRSSSTRRSTAPRSGPACVFSRTGRSTAQFRSRFAKPSCSLPGPFDAVRSSRRAAARQRCTSTRWRRCGRRS